MFKTAPRDAKSPEFPGILSNFYRCFRSPELICESPGFDTFLYFFKLDKSSLFHLHSARCNTLPTH